MPQDRPALSRDTAALIVIDMQNAFCHPDGSFASMTSGRGMSIDMCREAIGGCRRLVGAARQASVPVIFTRYVYHPNYVDGGVLVAKYPQMQALGSLAAGSWDAEIISELAPGPDDVVIDKSRYSAFYGTRLQPVLDGLGSRSLVVCGVTTNICVETTVRDAAQRDYDVFVAADATGELTKERHDNALAIIEYGFGSVVTVDDVVAALQRVPDRYDSWR
jgi:ureidoacrylate peracid hydrolase